MVAIILSAFVSLGISMPRENTEPLLQNQPEKEVLANGLSVVYHKDNSSSISVVHILMQGGKRLEPEGKQGLAFLTTRLLVELPSQQVLQQLMNQATHISFFCRQDFSIIRMSCLSENLEEAVKLSTQILQNPLFSGIRTGRIKEQMNHYEKLEEDQPLNVAHAAAMATFFRKTPYAGGTYGTTASRKKIKKKDIEKYYEESVKAKNMIVSISTDLGKEETLEIMHQYFGNFPDEAPIEPTPISFLPREERIGDIEKDTQQTLVYTAYSLPKVSEKNFILSTMLQNLLGKGMDSRLWSLRTAKRLAYIVDARAFLMRDGGMLETFLETDQTKKERAIAELKKTIRDLYEKGISSEELAITKAYSKGAAIRENETKETKALNLATMEALGLGYDFLNRTLEEIDAITLEEFNGFIRGVLNPEKAVHITVGPTQ